MSKVHQVSLLGHELALMQYIWILIFILLIKVMWLEPPFNWIFYFFIC